MKEKEVVDRLTTRIKSLLKTATKRLQYFSSDKHDREDAQERIIFYQNQTKELKEQLNYLNNKLTE